MSLLIYNLSIQFYRGLLSLISPFNSRARKWLKGREGLIASVEEEMNENENEPALAKATAGKNGPTLAPRLREAHDGAR
ncbi:MAG: hypothetical protein IIA45_08080, partial [Bacteroidetes bacterium]|nr:hypothetical protein [Bacteroidota bacterium]